MLLEPLRIQRPASSLSSLCTTTTATNRTPPTSRYTMPADDGSFSIPQVAACVIIGYFVLRWFLKSPDAAAATSSSGSSSTAAPASRRPVDRRRLAQQVEVVKGMFPQFSEAAIEAELLRNGLSIEVTTDRILSTGFLPEVSSSDAFTSYLFHPTREV